MHTLACELAEALADNDEVVVATRPGHTGRLTRSYGLRHVITEHAADDIEALNAIEPDVWIAMNGGLLPILGGLDRPSFVYLHGNDFLNPWLTYGSHLLEPIKRPYLRNVRKFLRIRAMRSASHVPLHYFANSRRTLALATETLRLPTDSISVCPPGVGAAFFQQHEPSDNNRIDMISVTRLTQFSRRKNIDGVLRAVAEISDEMNVKLTVVGDGDDLKRLQRLASDLGVAECVRFAGRLSDDELLACYRHSDLFVLASKATSTDVEGFGIVYLEAAASGVPVMGSAQGGATDAIEDGVNGIVLANSEPTTIADGFRRFHQERQQFDSVSLQAWTQTYRWPRIAERLRTMMVDHLKLNLDAA